MDTIITASSISGTDLIDALYAQDASDLIYSQMHQPYQC